MDNKVNISLLEESYLKAKIAYYEGTPFLTDAEFDALELVLKVEGSKVIEQVGSKRKDFDFTHPTKMLSLAKIQTEATEEGTNYVEDLFQRWFQKRKQMINGANPGLWASPKFDGNAINIIYRGDKLANVLTRGDGFTGKDVTKRFIGANKVPEVISLLGIDELSKEDIIEIRCEVVIKAKLFEDKYSKEFANPRNYVAGVIGKDEEDLVKMSELDIIPLSYLINGKHAPQNIFGKNITFARDYNTPLFAENYVDVIKAHENLRKTYKYQLDGVVISFPIEFRDILGENDHDPEWALAIKFVPVQVITEVQGIEWNLSKRGEIIPTLLLKPVLLDGSTVRRASGYNAGYLVENSIGRGALVSIAKAGDIIPEIQKVIVPSAETPVNLFPEICPACGSNVFFNQVHLVCVNDNCVGRIAKQLAYAVKILELKGIGEKTIEPFAKDFKNMYELMKSVIHHSQTNAQAICSEDGLVHSIEEYGIKYGSRSHQIFKEAFTNIKSLTYTQIIQMLGYDNVGEKLSTQLAREHADLDFDYSNLERALVHKMRSPEVSLYIMRVVQVLENLGITIDRPKKKESTGAIYVCMTGSPKAFGFATKADFISKFPMVEEVSISDKKCQYLITDDYNSTSNKMGVANKKGIKIFTYGDFKIE
jgi:NAD-dependent DNA ligase